MAIVWWYWLALGLVLIALELAASGGFYIIFFGVAAVLISGLTVIGASGPAWVQLLLFSILSVVSLLFFRSPLIRWMKLDAGRADVDSLVGETAIVQQDIPAGQVGRVELRGTSWTARNRGTDVLTTGRRCVVVGVDRLMLIIEAEGART
ncbi:MAG TPA: NfeD family protein [Vicinamibacterales bacterium]|nr:NfeD family protein [Vicinamibacterales bacterium]